MIMDRKNKKGRKKEVEIRPQDEKPSKMEYDVAKFLKGKLPEKRTTLLGHKVDYFIASKAIDALMDSKWAQGNKKNDDDVVFTSREVVVDFMDLMLRHKFFHRAKKIIVEKEEKPKAKKKKEEKSAAEESSAAEDHKDKSKKSGKEKEKEVKERKRKVKLDMHLEQIYVDANEPYVWIYDPIPLKTWIIGTALVFGAIAVCLFPLWPRTVRTYVYYLSIAAAGFLFFIIGLAVVRVVIFVVVWCVTFGRHHFWLLPNLTEDVGFFESFWPLYQYEYKGPNDETSESEKSGQSDEQGDKKKLEEDDDDKESRKSSLNGRNSDNGFEMLDSEEVAGVSSTDNDTKKDK